MYFSKYVFLFLFYFFSIKRFINSINDLHNHSLNIFNNVKKNLLNNKKNSKALKMFDLDENINFNILSNEDKENIYTKLKLKIFNLYVEQIYKWNTIQIKEEYSRIKNITKSNDYLDNLIMACFKSYLMFVLYDPSTDEPLLEDKLLDNRFYLNIDIHNFIHNCFFEIFYFLRLLNFYN